MATRTTFNSLQMLKRNMSEEFTVEKIKEILELNERDNVDLQNVRDFAVMYFSNLTEDHEGIDIETYNNYRSLMSYVTGVIDNMKWDRGMEV